MDMWLARLRQNQYQWSEDFTNARWSSYGVTVAGDNRIAPNGDLTGDRVTDTASFMYHYLAQSNMYIPSGPDVYTTLYAIASGVRITLDMYDLAGVRAMFDLSGDGSVIDIQGTEPTRWATITRIESSEWFQLRTFGKGKGNLAASYIYLQSTSETSVFSLQYTGTGAGVAFIWGAQIAYDNGPYIRTETTAITNSADVVKIFPEWDYERLEERGQWEHKASTGRVYNYELYTKDHVKFPVNNVPRGDALRVNSWRENSQTVVFMENDYTEVTCGHLIGGVPLSKRNIPNVDEYAGVIDLESF